MAIYLNTDKVSDLRAFADNPVNKTYQVIGTVYASATQEQSLTEKQMHEHLRLLGVRPSDKEAARLMTQFFRDVKEKLCVVPTENTGVYFIQKNNENIAVFKIGHKRAVMELIARKFAHYLGLERHMIPGMLCAIQNPPFQFAKSPKETIEELWSGNEKIFLDPANPHSRDRSRESSASAASFEDDFIFDQDPIPAAAASPIVRLPSSDSEEGTGSIKSNESTQSFEKTACVVVGIVQPFLVPQLIPSPLFEYTLMTILALAIGLRDGKKDGYAGATLFDVEDCMPRRVDPVPNNDKIEQTVSALDLPFLDKDIRTVQQLTEDETTRLAEIVQKWNISKIIHKLHKEKITAIDQAAENLHLKNDGFDDGSCLVSVETPVSPHLINGVYNHVLDNPKKRALTDEQLDACDTRLHRIRDFIIGCKMKRQPFSPKLSILQSIPMAKLSSI